ncbi:hypothetical protein CY658_03010 [Variovorax sp. RO1]|uniref:hypothetical protein n=1 Tax=Variovorax sp. RO1 TaxID=2066034 RepID=UPI000C7185FD|nr:hypothetical protein [Variovorax sp. RO1]PLC06033.1 hypothetical protein CY658_03010 [Variovorax sp. RO1]
MTETTVAMQREIFDQPLEGRQLQAVDALVEQHKGNAALTQQLALDASRLIASSQERLAKQSGSGFFKRFVSKINGKNGENQLQNQVDMLQMQRCAWHYLKQLQHQNLINAQAIAVIRNNLGSMNDVIIETRDFLEEAIDKINRRLKHVENNASFHSWSLHIEANKRRFKSIPLNLLVVHLTYDFMRSHRDVVLTSSDINHLLVTLEKLGVNCDEKTSLLSFISELIAQIEVTGVDRYRTMIELAFDDHSIASGFIQTNVSGIGFNALYFLSDQYEKILDLTEDSELCRNDKDREKIISKLFGAEFSGLSAIYSIRDLIGEVIGGSALAIDIYKETNGLNLILNEPEEDEYSEPVSLTSSLPEIRAHSFLDSAVSNEDRYNYLRFFALCIDASAMQSQLGREFLTQLADKAGRPELYGEIIDLADSPERNAQYLPGLQVLLNDDDKVYTWLLDAFFLLTLCQKKIENPQMLRILGVLKPAQFKENLPRLLTLINESDEVLQMDAIVQLMARTRGWKNIVGYRELRFERSYAETERELNSVRRAANSLYMDLLKVGTQASNYSVFIGSFDGDSFLGKLGSAVGGSAYSMGRSSSLSSLNEMREKVRKFISENSTPLNTANRIAARFNMPAIGFDNEISYAKYELDNSAANDNWFNEFERFEKQINDSLNAFSGACSDAIDQLSYFKSGEFSKSVIEIREKKRAEFLSRQHQEKLEKQSVVLEKNGERHLFRIEWEKIENPPCDPDNVSHIKTDGKVWLIVDTSGTFYRSEDRQHWQTVRPSSSDGFFRVRNVFFINGKWIALSNHGEGFYYSLDALVWQQTSFPDLPSSYGYRETEDVVFFNGLWVWRFTERTEFSYAEKGFFYDSEKTSTYEKACFYCLDRLDGQWQRWESTPQLPEGVEVESVHSVLKNECLLMFCKYDWSYVRAKRKNGDVFFVKYHTPAKGWRNCTWGGKDEKYGTSIVTQMGDRLMCLRSNELLTSEKGYEWKRQSQDFYVDSSFHLEDVSLFFSNRNNKIKLSGDGRGFEELILEDGNWWHLCANNQGLLSVYSPNSHETFLQNGRIICEAVA